jgi:1,2-diacylglycerol 3-alpha-glucosyltransferase
MNSTSKLRIAFVADTVNGRIGGGVVSAHHVIERLRRDHEIVVIGADAEGPGKLRGFTLPFTPQREMDFVLALPNRKKIERLIATVDVVHLQFPFFLGRSALLAARRQRRPVVAAFHVQPENAFLNVGLRSRWLNNWLYRLWVRGIYNRADAVVVPTIFAERKLREHGLTVQTRVISNGVSPDLGPSGASSMPRREGPFLVLMAGRLATEKRQEVLIEALRLSKHEPQIKLVIAGAGPNLKKLKHLSRGLTNPPEIGFVSRERLAVLFRAADLFVHCSEVELEGMAVLEAMSVGLPALVAQSSESAASEFALDDHFRFPAGDASSLASRLDFLFEHPEVLRSARPLYLAAARRLDFKESVHKLVDLYRSVMAMQGGAADQMSAAEVPAEGQPEQEESHRPTELTSVSHSLPREPGRL